MSYGCGVLHLPAKRGVRKMGLLGDGNHRLGGFSCVSKPNCSYDDPDAPLMCALGFALSDLSQLDLYLHSILPPYPEGRLGGGDPGWLWYAEKRADGSYIVTVEIDSIIAPPKGMWNDYSVDKIAYEIRATLENIAITYPSSLNEVDRIVNYFKLQKVKTFNQFQVIPDWTGQMPSVLINNEKNNV